jgi:FkbM family methyltransferase
MIAAWLTERLIHMPHFKGRVRFIRWLLRLSDGRTVRSRYGVRMRIRAADFTNQAAVVGTFRRDYDDVYVEVAALEPGMAFIDIGANHGLFTLVAGKRVGPQGAVLAFEPDFTNFHYLVANVFENELRNVFLFNAAISRENGVKNFQPGPETHSGIGHIAPDGPNRVMVLNFSHNLQVFGAVLGNRRTLVKIDVEGHEAHVISALSPLLLGPAVEKLVVEIDEENLAKYGSTAADVYDSLSAAGFQARRGPGAARHYNDIFVRTKLVHSYQLPATEVAAQ